MDANVLNKKDGGYYSDPSVAVEASFLHPLADCISKHGSCTLDMLRDKIRRRSFSDNTGKDYLSFGRLVVIRHQNGFCGGEK